MHTPTISTARRGYALFATAAVFAALATALPAQAANRDFDVVNRTNQPIVALWASPVSSSSWGQAFDNVFVPDSGGRQSMQVNGSGSGCHYDVRVQFDGGAVRYWTNLNLCAIRGMQIYVSSGEVKASTW